MSDNTNISSWCCLVNATIWGASTDSHGILFAGFWLVLAVIFFIKK